MKAGHPRTLRTRVIEGAINAALERQPCRTARCNAKELDPQPLSVREVLLDEHLDPCHFLWKVHLFPDDRPVHLFYVWLQGAHALLFWYLSPFDGEMYLENSASQDICLLNIGIILKGAVTLPAACVLNPFLSVFVHIFPSRSWQHC